MPRISGRQKEETRQRILSVSKDLFLNHGFYNTSTSQIAHQVGIAEGTIFNYFATKADIFLASVADDFFSSVTGTEEPLEESTDAVDSIIRYIHRHVDNLLMLPKKVLIELTTALLGKVSSKENIVEELILIDQYYIERLIGFLDLLKARNLITETSSKTLAECIFGIVFMELFIYLNIYAYSKDDVAAGVGEKIAVLMAGHIRT